jgi:hypothetical protein
MGYGKPFGNGESRPTPSGREEEVEPPIVLQEWPAPLEEAGFFGLAGEIVRAIEPETEADPVAIHMQLLVAFGNLIGRSAYGVVGPARHYCILHLLLIGESARARKGTAWTEVGRLLEPIDEQWWKRLGPGLSTGEGLITAVRDKLEGKEAIKEKGRVVDYQDVITDHGIADKRLMVVETEFSRALQAMQREGSTLNSIVRETYDGGLLRSLTKGFPYQATGAHISIIGHGVATELQRLLGGTDLVNGFANRFLWVACRSTRLLPFGGNPGFEIIKGFQKRLQEAVEWSRSSSQVKWTEEAMALWKEQYPFLRAPRPGTLGSVVSRAESHAFRLALITALLNRKPAIEEPHLKAALAMVAYSERSAAFILGDRLADPEETAILDYVKCKPGASRSDIRRQVFNDHKPAHEVANKLASLLRTGLIRQGTVSPNGRAKEGWFAVSSTGLRELRD